MKPGRWPWQCQGLRAFFSCCGAFCMFVVGSSTRVVVLKDREVEVELMGVRARA